jgi:hypothetical protein
LQHETGRTSDDAMALALPCDLALSFGAAERAALIA